MKFLYIVCLIFVACLITFIDAPKFDGIKNKNKYKVVYYFILIVFIALGIYFVIKP